MSVSIPFCPVLYPKYDEFKKFEEYVNKIEEEYGKDYGMVKIVPPPQWISHTNNYNKILKGLVFDQPEHQTIYTKINDFAFQCENGKSHTRITLEDFKRDSEKKLKEISQLSSIQQIEQYFWHSVVKNIYKEVYCANVEVSLMDKNSGAWEFERLESMFSRAVKEELKGLNTSFLFIGAWKTFFNWHIEDLDLSAINILHQGAPKVWYAIHPQDRKKFEGIITDIFPEKSLTCTNFLRHKSIFVNPYKLKEKYPYLRISRMYQQPNEISLAFSEGYHCGFNMGFNIAEAVNYGSQGWLEKLSKFKGCKCPQKVGITIQSFQQVIKNLQNCPKYKEIQSTSGFKKIFQKAEQQRQQDEKFQNLSKEQIYKEFLKEKTKKINKGLKQIYVPKYKRYFPSSYSIEEQLCLSIECDKCHKWRTVSSEIIEKYQNEPFNCSYIGKECLGQSRKQKPGNKKSIKTKVKSR